VAIGDRIETPRIHNGSHGKSVCNSEEMGSCLAILGADDFHAGPPLGLKVARF
jgi:hypothetical protein